MKGILGSVGHGAKNIRQDVILVQELLNHKIQRLTGEKKLVVDGFIGKKTVALISRYQQVVLKMRKPDGRVDPKGKTFSSLYERHAVVPPAHAPNAIQDIWSGDSARWPQEKKLRSLNTQFRSKVEAVLKKLKDEGYQPKIFYGWRSVAVQLDLYNRKRSKVKFSFHNATQKHGMPNAYAADIIDSRYAWNDKPETKAFWKALGKAAKEQGLHWGGDWTSFKDWAHVQMHPNNRLRSIMLETQAANK